MGTSYRVEKDGDDFVYKIYSMGYTLEKETLICPSQEQWLAFWKKMDEIGVWGWKKRYDNPDIMDGTSWSVDIEYGDKRCNSSGSNSYPDGNRFDTFLAAVRDLMGSVAFV